MYNRDPLPPPPPTIRLNFQKHVHTVHQIIYPFFWTDNLITIWTLRCFLNDNTLIRLTCVNSLDHYGPKILNTSLFMSAHPLLLILFKKTLKKHLFNNCLMFNSISFLYFVDVISISLTFSNNHWLAPVAVRRWVLLILHCILFKKTICMHLYINIYVFKIIGPAWIQDMRDLTFMYLQCQFPEGSQCNSFIHILVFCKLLVITNEKPN